MENKQHETNENANLESMCLGIFNSWLPEKSSRLSSMTFMMWLRDGHIKKTKSMFFCFVLFAPFAGEVMASLDKLRMVLYLQLSDYIGNINHFSVASTNICWDLNPGQQSASEKESPYATGVTPMRLFDCLLYVRPSDVLQSI